MSIASKTLHCKQEASNCKQKKLHPNICVLKSENRGLTCYRGAKPPNGEKCSAGCLGRCRPELGCSGRCSGGCSGKCSSSFPWHQKQVASTCPGTFPSTLPSTFPSTPARAGTSPSTPPRALFGVRGFSEKN